MTTGSPNVVVENLSKCYRIYPDSRARVKELLCFGKKKFHEEKWATQNVSFELYPGQALGIIGFNGAGKSTLLKLLTGTTAPTSGSFKLTGSVSSLLELGAGFHPDFTGRDNIYMNAAIQGISRAEVDRRFDEIAEFSELGEFLDRPVRTYSSGMAMRLGFSASMLADPEILILDEILAVGDIHFQKKCIDQFNRFREQNKTILFVSHSVYHVRQICDRVIWIHDGQVVMDGDPIAVTDEYETRMLEMRDIQRQHAAKLAQEIIGSPTDEVGSVEGVALFKGDDTEPCTEFVCGDSVRIRIRYRHTDTSRGVLIAFGFIRNDGLLCSSSRTDEPVFSDAVDSEIEVTIPNLQLLAGEYQGSVHLTDDSGVHVMDQQWSAVRIKVTHPGVEKGIFLADSTWSSPVASTAPPPTAAPDGSAH